MSNKNKGRPSLLSPAPNESTLLKAPEVIARKGGDKQYPVFCLHHVDPSWCITNCEPQDKINFANRLRALSQISWEQIKIAPRHGLGTEKITRHGVKFKIPPEVTSDVELIALRFSGKKPMVGYRDLDVFHIICFDRNFRAYNHGS